MACLSVLQYAAKEKVSRRKIFLKKIVLWSRKVHALARMKHAKVCRNGNGKTENRPKTGRLARAKELRFQVEAKRRSCYLHLSRIDPQYVQYCTVPLPRQTRQTCNSSLSRGRCEKCESRNLSRNFRHNFRDSRVPYASTSSLHIMPLSIIQSIECPVSLQRVAKSVVCSCCCCCCCCCWRQQQQQQ